MKQKLTIVYTIILLLGLCKLEFGQSASGEKTQVYFEGNDIMIKGDQQVNTFSLIIQVPEEITVLNVIPNPDLPNSQQFFGAQALREKDKVIIGWYSFNEGINPVNGYKICTLVTVFTGAPPLKFLKEGLRAESEVAGIDGQPLDVEFINK